jgi:chaperone required for assembly of F1-ATPase
MHVDQPPESLSAFSVHVGQINEPAVLAATHVVMTLTGSAILAMAVCKGHLEADEAWKLAHLDEDWNISLWGEDEEAMERRAKRLLDMTAACDVIKAIA